MSCPPIFEPPSHPHQSDRVVLAAYCPRVALHLPRRGGLALVTLALALVTVLVGCGNPTLERAQSMDDLVVTQVRPEMVHLGDLSADWDGRRVEVLGVVRQVSQADQGASILELRDATGVVDLVVPAGKIDSALDATDRSVRAVGIVAAEGGAVRIVLSDSADLDMLSIWVEFAPQRMIVEIGPRDAGRFVHLFGRITDFVPATSDLWLTLADDTGEIAVLLRQELADLIRSTVDLEPGHQLVVVGQIADHQGQLAIVPETESDVKVVGRAPETPTVTAELTSTPGVSATPNRAATNTLTRAVTATATQAATATPTQVATATPTTLPTSIPSATPAPPPLRPVPIGSISAADEGETVVVQGRVTAAASFSAGFKFTLDDGTGTITLLLWTERYAQVMGRGGLRPGALVMATGLVAQYEGELQVQPFPEDVLLQEAGGGPPVETVATGQAGQHMGYELAVEATVVRLEFFSGHLRLIVDDGSGELQVILWQNVLELAPAELLVEGQAIRVLGQVSEYRGQVQLVPALPVYVTGLN